MKLEILLKDPKLVSHIERSAKKAKAQDVAAHAIDLLIKSARKALGLDGDLTVSEVAQRLNCHPNTVRNYIRTDRLGAYYPSARCLRIPLASVEALTSRTKYAA
jgi:excisionase family DNA binding protein